MLRIITKKGDDDAVLETKKKILRKKFQLECLIKMKKIFLLKHFSHEISSNFVHIQSLQKRFACFPKEKRGFGCQL